MDPAQDYSANLRQTITELYIVFKCEPRLSEAFANCAWLTHEQAQILATKPLATLSTQDLSHYTNHLWDCGAESDFRYFLPRMCELFAGGNFVISPEMFPGDLLHVCRSIPEKEVIETFLMRLWQSIIQSFPAPYDPDEYLCALAQVYQDIQAFLDVWDTMDSPHAMRQLALFSNHATYCGGWQKQQTQMRQVVNWLLRPVVTNRLKAYAETHGTEPFAKDMLEAAHVLSHWKESIEEGR